MFVTIGVHRVKPGKEDLMIDSMHRFGAAARASGGLERVHTLKDPESGALLGLAIWESEEAYNAAVPNLIKAVEGDDFDDWHERPWETYHCTEI